MIATRRLAAILAADVAGYSRLIGADESGTLQGLKAIRAELIDPTIAAHNGRLVKTTGDGFLVEFSSVVDALRCATEMQAGMVERNADVTPDRRIEFRIGINMGDVVVEDGDIFGDGVNVAARLEGFAEPGGICVSARAGGRGGQARPLFRGFGRADTQEQFGPRSVGSKRRRKSWKAIAVAPAWSDMMYGARRGCGRKIMPTCSRVSARPDGRADTASRARFPDLGSRWVPGLSLIYFRALPSIEKPTAATASV